MLPEKRGAHPNSLKALEANKYKKGKKPTGGRPKGSLSLKDRMRHYLELEVPVEIPNGTITDRTILDGIIIALFKQAAAGNVMAIKEVFDRHFGKEADTIMMKHEDALREMKELK